MTRKHYINNALDIGGVWGEVQQSLKDTDAHQSFLREYDRSLKQTASIALQCENLEEFTTITENIPNNIFQKWFLKKWPNYVEFSMMAWREFGWIQFESSPPPIDIYYKYLKIFQDLVRYSIITRKQFSKGLDALHYYNQVDAISRKWPDEYKHALSLPYIGIELALIQRRGKIKKQKFVNAYTKLLDAPLMSQPKSQYFRALDDSIANIFGWDIWAIDYQDNRAGKGFFIQTRKNILLALTIRLAYKKYSLDWFNNLTSRDFDDMINSLEEPETGLRIDELCSDTFEVLKPSLTKLLTEKKNEFINELEKRISKSELDPQVTTEFNNSARDKVGGYRTDLIMKLQKKRLDIREDSEKVLSSAVSKRYFLQPVDSAYYQVDADVFFEAQSEIDEANLIKKLTGFARGPQKEPTNITINNLVDSKEIIENKLGVDIDTAIVICINLNWGESNTLHQLMQDRVEIYETSYRHANFQKSIICLGSSSDVHWNQFKLKKSINKSVLAQELVDDDYFSIELHSDENDKSKVFIKFRQSYQILQDSNSNIFQILFNPVEGEGFLG